MASGVKIGGTWKTPGTPYVKVSGTWRIASVVYTKVGGVWKTTTLGAPPATPTLSHTALGQFTIQSYNSTLVYTPTLLTGSGTATLNTTTGVYTLSNVNSRFSVTAGYASNAPQSSAAYMERKAYTCTNTNHPYTTCEGGGCYAACCVKCNGTDNFCCWGGSLNSQGDLCCTPCTTVYHDNWTCDKDALPSGYTDTYGEWWRTT